MDAELEAVLSKALSHEPERRYGTAGGLAADLERYLNGEPLEAQPPTLRYLLSKKLHRYRALLAVAGAVLMILAGMAVWAYVGVTAERNSARLAQQSESRQLGVAKAQTILAKASELHAVEARAAAERSKAAAESAKTVAENAKTAAEESRLLAQTEAATGLVLQGDALGQASQWLAARERYEQAITADWVISNCRRKRRNMESGRRLPPRRRP